MVRYHVREHRPDLVLIDLSGDLLIVQDPKAVFDQFLLRDDSLLCEWVVVFPLIGDVILDGQGTILAGLLENGVNHALWMVMEADSL